MLSVLLTVWCLPEYRIIGKKGEGTFSTVLKCQSVKDGSYYACKRMKQSFKRWLAVSESGRGLVTFLALSLSSVDEVNNLREIQAMRKLTPHPHIVQLVEAI